MKFDSKKEAKRWGELLLLQSAGLISGLRRQVRIPIVVNQTRVCVYVADAVYIEGSSRIVEDTKSPITRKHPVYRLKRKLLSALYKIDIREV